MRSACSSKQQGEFPISVEGYKDAEWVLVDYGDFLVHIFSPTRPRLLRSGTPLAQRQERRHPRGVKLFLYYIGKPRRPRTPTASPRIF